MDGVLLIDKPSGPTSHDVVARLRRTSGERAIGHTGTLDPRATGLLPLVLGRATRLASLLTGGDKVYEATIRLGFATDTDDADGRPLGEPVTALPADAEVDEALARFAGTFEQTPPSHSAKKVGGRKAYELARREEPVELKPVTVTIRALERTGRAGDLVSIRVTASSGFYVRALARDLGARLGCGAHLVGLRRTHSGSFDVGQALPLEDAERLGRGIAARVLPPADALPELAAVRTTEAGLRRALHGNPLGPEHLESRWLPPATSPLPVKILASDDGRLVALARSRGGALHPVVVLG
ncbi:MAG: tRNA pseudouridine(55) synthase TruB [Vicinamibacterales bacterium]